MGHRSNTASRTATAQNSGLFQRRVNGTITATAACSEGKQMILDSVMFVSAVPSGNHYFADVLGGVRSRGSCHRGKRPTTSHLL